MRKLIRFLNSYYFIIMNMNRTMIFKFQKAQKEIDYKKKANQIKN